MAKPKPPPPPRPQLRAGDVVVLRPSASGIGDDERNRPDHDGTSRLSPYLHLGVLHPRSLLAESAREFLPTAPRVAMLSFSNFGSNTHPNAQKVKRAVEIVKAARRAGRIINQAAGS